MSTIHLNIYRKALLVLVIGAVTMLTVPVSCNKSELPANLKGKPSTNSSAVLDKWITLQLRLMRNATGIPNHGFSRHFAYAGIAAYESLKPGLHGPDKWSRRWNGLSGLPLPVHSRLYHYPASLNAAMATINRSMFPAASVADKASIDSLEMALKQEFLATEQASAITLSTDFGKAVASAVYAWAETDGYKKVNDPYTAPIGPGLWKPTPPAFTSPATPYWGKNRAIISNSTDISEAAPPPAYSIEPGSPFYVMVKEVFDASLVLTDDQKAMAAFWRDVPGVSSPGHWLSILQQAAQQSSMSLDDLALAYALTGVAINDALISCFQAKYQLNLVRPVTYIREVMGQPTWNPFLGTPAHPEFSSAHSALSMAAAKVLEELVGDIGPITDHTYDYLGYAPRTYLSFVAIAEEAGLSRFYAGIHYKPSIEAGIIQGNSVAASILSKQNSPQVPGGIGKLLSK